MRRSLAGRWRLGLGLFVFRAVLVWSLLGTVLAGAVLAAPGTAERATAALPADVDLDSPVAALVLAAAGCYAVLAGLTTRFVAPIMLVEEVGVLAGWRRLLGLLAGAPHQYLAYLLVSPFVRFAADVLALSAAVLLVVALTIPLVAVVVPVAVLLGSDAAVLASPAAVGVALGLLPAYLLAVAAGAVVLRVPFVAYVRYYALLVLVGTDPELSL